MTKNSETFFYGKDLNRDAFQKIRHTRLHGYAFFD